MTFRLNNMKRMTLSAGIALLSAVALGAVGCNGQSFEVPPEQAEYGQKVTLNNQVDVLFVVDTTGSMDTVQQKLASQMGSMIESFDQTGLDYQFAVTTMDMGNGGEKGRFLYQPGTPAILTAGTPNVANILASRLHIGDYDWQPLARAFEATKAALTGANAASGPNAGFLRDNALLMLIYLSNEDDDSASADYKAFLDKLRPNLKYGARSWVAHFMGVLPNDAACKTSAWSFRRPGMNFIALANASGGAVESICSGDLATPLKKVKARILEMMTEYPLPAKPVVATIKVSVNGVSVPQNETDGWTYIEASNSVRFHGTAIPAVDANIRVDFDRDGLK